MSAHPRIPSKQWRTLTAVQHKLYPAGAARADVRHHRKSTKEIAKSQNKTANVAAA
jgi:hypothetical protein